MYVSLYLPIHGYKRERFYYRGPHSKFEGESCGSFEVHIHTYIHPCSTHLLCRHSHLLRLPAHRTTLYSSLLSHDSREQRLAAATAPCSGVTVAVVRGAAIAAGLMANRGTQPCSMCVAHLLIH